MNSFEYSISHTCSICGKTDYFEISKREAAFEIISSGSKDKIPCSNCGSLNFNCWGISKPELDRQLFIEWCNDEELYFLVQDEDLVIAEERYIDYILEMIDKNIATPGKKQVLYSALCVIVYDELKRIELEGVNQKSSSLTDRVINELQKRKTELLNAETYIWPYIKEVVFPMAGIK